MCVCVCVRESTRASACVKGRLSDRERKKREKQRKKREMEGSCGGREVREEGKERATTRFCLPLLFAQPLFLSPFFSRSLPPSPTPLILLALAACSLARIFTSDRGCEHDHMHLLRSPAPPRLQRCRQSPAGFLL